jgi:dihydrofolate reductase
MRKLIITEFVSLDGVVENPMWTFKYWNDEVAAFKSEETSAGQDLLLGRVTYEGFAQAWPQRGKAEGGEYFNGTRKYVVTSTLDNLEWNNSVALKGDLVEEVRKLKAQDGPDIVVHGSVELVQALIKNDLVDTVRMLVYPVVLGEGKRMFLDGTKATLKLVETRPISSGVVGLIYELAHD